MLYVFIFFVYSTNICICRRACIYIKIEALLLQNSSFLSISLLPEVCLRSVLNLLSSLWRCLTIRTASSGQTKHAIGVHVLLDMKRKTLHRHKVKRMNSSVVHGVRVPACVVHTKMGFGVFPHRESKRVHSF